MLPAGGAEHTAYSHTNTSAIIKLSGPRGLAQKYPTPFFQVRHLQRPVCSGMLEWD